MGLRAARDHMNRYVAVAENGDTFALKPLDGSRATAKALVGVGNILSGISSMTFQDLEGAKGDEYRAGRIGEFFRDNEGTTCRDYEFDDDSGAPRLIPMSTINREKVLQALPQQQEIDQHVDPLGPEYTGDENDDDTWRHLNGLCALKLVLRSNVHAKVRAGMYLLTSVINNEVNNNVNHNFQLFSTDEASPSYQHCVPNCKSTFTYRSVYPPYPQAQLDQYIFPRKTLDKPIRCFPRAQPSP